MPRIFDGFKLAVRDVKVWIFVFISCFQSIGTSFGSFFPTSVFNGYHVRPRCSPNRLTSLTKTLGYNTTDTLLLAA